MPVILLTALALALVGLHIDGVLVPYIAADRTGIILAVAAVAVLATALARWRRKFMVWVIDQQVCPTLGLLGTVLGFTLALSGVAGDVSADKLAGVHMALNTTGAGLLAHLWLLCVRELTRAP